MTTKAESAGRLALAILVGTIFGLMTALSGEGAWSALAGGAIAAIAFWIGLPLVVRAARAITR